MNIIIFPRPRTHFVGLATSRHWNIFQLTFAVLTVSAILLGGGYILGISFGHEAILKEWKSDVVEHKASLDLAKQESQTQIDALTTKIGLLQAHVNRVDALGNMLVNMADLDPAEFSFETTPGVGGPHTPGQDSLEGGSEVDFGIDLVLAKLDAELVDREYQLQVLNGLLIDKKLEQETRPQGRPVASGWISSYFGKRQSPFTGKKEMHRGVDFAGRTGTDVLAVAGGVITQAKKKGGYGYLVEIDHGNGYKTRYGHNQMVVVKAGEVIKRGQVIAKLGSTGRSTGPHVHFEVIKNGKRIDPMKFVN